MPLRFGIGLTCVDAVFPLLQKELLMIVVPFYSSSLPSEKMRVASKRQL